MKVFTSLYRPYSGVFTDVQMSFESRVEELEGGSNKQLEKKKKKKTFGELYHGEACHEPINMI